MQPFISVIIPVYNIERYIGKCLDSIVGQTLKEIEIIVVDDGSTDDSSRIIDRYARTDSRIVAIHKTNGGVVSARNCGIAQATGLYILFVDGDDHLAPDACERLLRKAQATSADMVIMRFDIEYPQHKEEPRFWSQDEYDPVTAIHTMAHEEFRWSLWSRLMRKELFDRPVDCPPQLIFGEDAYQITTQENLIEIHLTTSVDSIFAKLINIDEYQIDLDYVGTKESDRVIINKKE